MKENGLIIVKGVKIEPDMLLELGKAFGQVNEGKGRIFKPRPYFENLEVKEPYVVRIGNLLNDGTLKDA